MVPCGALVFSSSGSTRGHLLHQLCPSLQFQCLWSSLQFFWLRLSHLLPSSSLVSDSSGFSPFTTRVLVVFPICLAQSPGLGQSFLCPSSLCPFVWVVLSKAFHKMQVLMLYWFIAQILFFFFFFRIAVHIGSHGSYLFYHQLLNTLLLNMEVVGRWMPDCFTFYWKPCFVLVRKAYVVYFPFFFVQVS